MKTKQTFSHRFQIFFTLFETYEIGVVFDYTFLQKKKESILFGIYEDGFEKQVEHFLKFGILLKIYDQTLILNKVKFYSGLLQYS